MGEIHKTLTQVRNGLGIARASFVAGGKMTMRRVLLVVGVGTCLVWPVAAVEQRGDPEVIFQAALYKEQVEFQLEQAIAGYKEVIASAGTNRSVAAKALLQMARCYERLGSPEASATYELIVKDYANTPEVAAAARAKVAAMRQKGAAPLVRKISEDAFPADAISPDGRYVTFEDDHNDVGVREVASGKVRMLTTKGKTTESWAGWSVPSPDSQRVAYSWWDSDSHAWELRVIGRDGGQPRVIFSNGPRYVPNLMGWSPDGNWILAAPDHAPAESLDRDLMLIPVGTGAPRTIKRGAERSGYMSPDGRLIAFNRPNSSGAAERDVFSLALDSGRESTLVANPADDYMLAWFPNDASNRILFASDREGQYGIWSTRVGNGITQGEPMLVRSDTGRVRDLGFTKDGSFYYGSSHPEDELYVASLDPSTGRQTGDPRRLEGRFAGGKAAPAWSPTGDRIAYIQNLANVSIRVGKGPRADQAVAIQTTSTGVVKLLPLALRGMGSPVWLPDGRSVIVQGNDSSGNGLFQVDVESEAVTPIVVRDPASSGFTHVLPEVSPDGQLLYYQRVPRGAPGAAGRGPGGIVVRELASGAEKVVTIEGGKIALSPDGKWFAVSRLMAATDASQRIRVIPSSGGESRSLSAVVDGWEIDPEVGWSHDSHSVFVVKLNTTSGTRSSEVWQVPLDGSAPRDTGIRLRGSIDRIRAHPDGVRIVLATRHTAWETWVIQNLASLRDR